MHDLRQNKSTIFFSTAETKNSFNNYIGYDLHAQKIWADLLKKNFGFTFFSNFKNLGFTFFTTPDMG